MRYLAGILFMATVTASGQHVKSSDAEVFHASWSVAKRVCASHPAAMVWLPGATGEWQQWDCAFIKNYHLVDFFDAQAANRRALSDGLNDIQKTINEALQASKETR